ncbi:tyrosine-protein phosphatase non-receptor type 2-like isoform X2 [Salvelinus fontinalis]|uniref:tyrosine-protein phosphatase non-receptor type 2-like isoform X2 n=1 Tax=Salvelinus fontinalis TaxID=8038 RepID=UPI00248699DA|nr:tyrosine-protein phosphatase non-receptor type 2-like isoform X2 [Salvelinus fontinalis]
MDQQFEEIDSSGQWQNLYNEIRNQASDYSYKMAKLPENQNRNRYRDVSPYDHSRVKLEKSENDYINASLVMVEEAQRSYILSQGPLKNTCGHFWLMVWEQNSKAVIMLNRIVEKGSEKCAQYWPTAEGHQLSYTDTGFVVTLVKEEDKSYYIIRVLELRNTETGGTREIYHFHYTTWPDFGVPESPASFLNFLVKVRESGSLGTEHGPAVVHCSAGIGRSGTFSLVDTCLILMDKRKDPSSVDIQRVLLDMREYRMGLIQTPDQLRFSYRAVLEGAKSIMGDCSVQSQWSELSREDRATVCESPPAPTLPPPRPLDTPTLPPPRPSDAPTLPPPRPLDTPTLPPPRPSDAPALPPPRPSDAPTLPPPRPSDTPTLPPPRPLDTPTLPPPRPSDAPALPPPRPLDSPAPTLPPPRPLDGPAPTLPPPRPSDTPTPPRPLDGPAPTLPPPRPLDAPTLPPPRPLDTPAPPSPSRPSVKPSGQPRPCVEPEAVALSREDRTSGDGTDPDSSEKDLAEVPCLRKRRREERIACTAQKLHLMKQRLTDTERQRERWLYWRPILLTMGAGAAVALGLVLVWHFSQ